jgi:hypothetical protein
MARSSRTRNCSSVPRQDVQQRVVSGSNAATWSGSRGCVVAVVAMRCGASTVVVCGASVRWRYAMRCAMAGIAQRCGRRCLVTSPRCGESGPSAEGGRLACRQGRRSGFQRASASLRAPCETAFLPERYNHTRSETRAETSFLETTAPVRPNRRSSSLSGLPADASHSGNQWSLHT